MWIELREIIHLGLKTPTQVQVISISNRRKKKQLRPFVKIISRTKSVTRPYFTSGTLHAWCSIFSCGKILIWPSKLSSHATLDQIPPFATWQKILSNKWGVNKSLSTQMPYCRITQKVRHLCHDRSLKLPYFTRLRNGAEMSPPPQKKKISFRVSIKPESHDSKSLI